MTDKISSEAERLYRLYVDDARSRGVEHSGYLLAFEYLDAPDIKAFGDALVRAWGLAEQKVARERLVTQVAEDIYMNYANALANFAPLPIWADLSNTERNAWRAIAQQESHRLRNFWDDVADWGDKIKSEKLKTLGRSHD